MDQPNTEQPRVEAIGSRVRGGAVILLAGRLMAGGFGTLVRMVILANLLGPDEFGLFGAALLAVGLLEVFTQSGLRHAVIQTDDVSRDTLDTAWTIQVLRGLLLGLLLLVAAPWLAMLTDRPEAAAPIRGLALVPVLMGLSSIGINFLERRLQYGRYVVLTAGISLIELVVSVLYALYSPTVWALVVGRIAATAMRLILSYFLCDTHAWFGFKLGKAKALFSYGIWILVSGLIAYALIKGGDYVVLHWLTESDFGLYFLAYQLATLPIMQVVQTVDAVTFSGYSRLKNEIPRLREAFLKSFLVIATVSFFLCSMVIAVAYPFERLFLSDAYTGISRLIEILAIWGLSRGLGAANNSLFLAVGRPALASIFQAVMLVLFAAAAIPAVTTYGLEGICWTLACVGAVVQPMRYPLTARDLQMSSWKIYLRVAVPLSAAVAAVAAAKALAWVMPGWNPWLHLFLDPLAGTIGFAAVMMLWMANRELDLKRVLTELIPVRYQIWRAIGVGTG
ncbi:oligosaccharide flippase family protein [Mucisphaera calidilacus]|uniref:Teichuronic acid biosynthesis protein TuaB n=1 Tax=Mucisphaera calidilacus TaxID=2527982 RepID=A0A518BVD9_9BACT|nr:oligosaccharide flippase family protein [Mucisphaera calidilacus]QDU70917.1 Teichuronic acid biosynthesis protein TuaB [Mucisphaera calidilacus]